jgi:uncharacterized protein
VIAIDTNLLVYAHRAALPEHRSARHAIERAAMDPRGWGVPQPTLAEFWSIVTHPAAGRPSTAAEARAFLQALLSDGRGHVWLPSPGFDARFLEAAVDVDVRGPRIFDLQIALLAVEHGAREIWTHDRNFLATPGLRVVDPL